MCPGVSMMLILWSFQKQVTAADVIVIPRSFSCAIQSVVAPSPSPRTTPILCVKPVRYKIPSVVVVLPASIWAIIPIFLKFFSGTCVSAINFPLYYVNLPRFLVNFLAPKNYSCVLLYQLSMFLTSSELEDF